MAGQRRYGQLLFTLGVTVTFTAMEPNCNSVQCMK
jgi:hypothetical protein